MCVKKLHVLTLASLEAIHGFGRSPLVYFTKDITSEKGTYIVNAEKIIIE